MVAVEQKAVPGVASTRGTTRMVVVGDSFFLGNRQIESAPTVISPATPSIGCLTERYCSTASGRGLSRNFG
jgi:hypothetical protein